MAQYIPFAPDVEVNGETILSFVQAIPAYSNIMLDILKFHGINQPKPGQWYSQESWLNAFKEIGEKYGANTLFAIGKAIPDNAQFPPDIDNLEKALSSIDIAYHMNHQGGEIGYYHLIDFQSEYRFAKMECKNPYPSNFDKGIITAIARKFKPDTAIVVQVELDENYPSRLNGSESCTYKVSW
ncbi:MAG: hypothetical protein HC913_07560 [Microscillaceae bacterium]|nr:hypothetical protein [Microscillaceae bacterium]